jgi:hypothetical protein
MFLEPPAGTAGATIHFVHRMLARLGALGRSDSDE